MTVIRIGDEMAPIISYLTAFFLIIFIAGGLLILFKLIIPSMAKVSTSRKSDSRIGLKILAAVCIPLMGLLYTNYRIYNDIYTLTIDPAGNWILSNPFGIDIDTIASKIQRTILFGSKEKLLASDSQYAKYVTFTHFYIQTDSGKKFDLSTNDGQTVQKELGYDDLSALPLTTNKAGWIVIPPHTYTSEGPWFCADQLRQAAFIDIELLLDRDRKWSHISRDHSYEIGDDVLAYWPNDGWWYAGKIIRQNRFETTVAFEDGSQISLPVDGIYPCQIPQSAEIQDNWQNKGTYWPCKVLDINDGRITVGYDDGSTSSTNMHRLRFRPEISQKLPK